MTAWAFTWLKPGMHFNIEILMAFRTAFSLVIPGFGVSRGLFATGAIGGSLSAAGTAFGLILICGSGGKGGPISSSTSSLFTSVMSEEPQVGQDTTSVSTSWTTQLM